MYVALLIGTWLVAESLNAWGIDLVFQYQPDEALPEEVTVRTKDGTVEIRRPRDDNKYWFRTGYDECIRKFVWLRPGLFMGDAPLDPYDEESGASLKPISGHWREANDAGFTACRLQLRQLSDRFGVPRVRQAVRWKTTPWLMYVAFHIEQNSEVIRLVGSTILGCLVIFAIVKLVSRASDPRTRKSRSAELSGTADNPAHR
jgi:hypothetical protein